MRGSMGLPSCRVSAAADCIMVRTHVESPSPKQQDPEGPQIPKPSHDKAEKQKSLDELNLTTWGGSRSSFSELYPTLPVITPQPWGALDGAHRRPRWVLVASRLLDDSEQELLATMHC